MAPTTRGQLSSRNESQNPDRAENPLPPITEPENETFHDSEPDHESEIERLRREITALREQTAATEAVRQTTEFDTPTNRRSTKLPDPPVFTGDKSAKIEQWISKLKSKLRMNMDHYPTAIDQIAYVESRLDGAALDQVSPRLEEDSLRPFTAAAEIFEYLLGIYGDANRKQTARKDFRDLRMGADFHTFWAEFQRLAAFLDYGESTLIEELRNKLAYRLQKALADQDEDPEDLHAFAKKIARIDQRQRDLPARANTGSAATKVASGPSTVPSRSYAAAATPTRATPATPSRPTTTPTPATTVRIPTRSVHPDPVKEQQMKEGKCFFCGNHGHRAKECPQKPKPSVNAVDVDTPRCTELKD